MSVAGALSPEESRVIAELASTGLPQATATLVVVLWTRRHVRPAHELLDLVASYPHLGDATARSSALDDATARRWTAEIGTLRGGNPLIQASEDLGETLRGILSEERRLDLDAATRDHLGVTVLGHMGTPFVYDSFGLQLERAQSDIALPMLATTHRLSQLDTMKERADAGVRVRILLATPDLVGRIRGASRQAPAKDNLRGWKTATKDHPNLHIRVTRHYNDIRDASSMLVDDRLLRYVVYDNEADRSTVGVMVEIDSERPTNLSRMFADRFNSAWNRARPLGFVGTLGWIAKRSRFAAPLVVFVTAWAAIRKDHPTAATLTLGAVIGYVVDHWDWLENKIAQLWSRLKS